MATEKEQALQERLHRRATVVCTVLRKFISNFYTGRQEMIDEARAKELAKLARKGKKGKGKKKDAPKNEPKPPAGKEKKPKKTPVQEAWQTFLADMDERINKQKRVGLEDIYRGTALLTPQEQIDLAALLATTNKKILPIASLNINQHNVRMALVAASAALSEMGAIPAKSCPGLRALTNRGASTEQLLEQGFGLSDAMRVGYTVNAAVEAGRHNLKELREAGIGIQDILNAPGTDLKDVLKEGPRGMRRLREAGYCASELVACGGSLANPWSLKEAGYTLTELYTVGFSSSELRAAGFGDPGLQPTVESPVTRSLQSTIQAELTNTVAPPLTGTQAPYWKEQLRRRAATQGGAAMQGGAGLAQPNVQASGASVEATKAPPPHQDAKRAFMHSFSMTVGVPTKA